MLAAAALALLLAGSGCDVSEIRTAREDEPEPPARARPEPEKRKPSKPAQTVEPSSCPAGLPECRTTEGRILYLERVDPDGDGDAHLVIEDPQGITLPGMTVIDVAVDLRPHPLPGPGDLVSAAGPVQTGSYGQSQIHAVELHVAGEQGY